MTTDDEMTTGDSSAEGKGSSGQQEIEKEQ
jgi:hypothetical protein